MLMITSFSPNCFFFPVLFLRDFSGPVTVSDPIFTPLSVSNTCRPSIYFAVMKYLCKYNDKTTWQRSAKKCESNFSPKLRTSEVIVRFYRFPAQFPPGQCLILDCSQMTKTLTQTWVRISSKGWSVYNSILQAPQWHVSGILEGLHSLHPFP